MNSDKINEAARKWFIGIPQNGDNLYHLTYEQIIKTIVDFAAQIQSEQKQPDLIQKVFVDRLIARIKELEENQSAAGVEERIDLFVNELSYRGSITDTKEKIKIFLNDIFMLTATPQKQLSNEEI